MKIKTSFLIFPFIAILSLASCGADSKKTETVKSDSAATKEPAALTKLNEEIKADPNNPDLYHERAKYYMSSKQYNAGINDMLHCLNIDSTKAQYFLTLSDLYFVTNKTSNSKIALEKCIKLDDKNVDAILKLAELYFYVKKNDKSIEYINMALKLNKYNAKAYFMKGMNYKEMKDNAKAISSMQKPVEHDHTYYNAYIQLGILNATQRNPLAIQYYKDALRIQPNSLEAWYDLGKYEQDVADWAKATEAYNTLLKIDPKYKNALYNLGVINLVGLKDYKAAVDRFSDAIKVDPAFIEAYYGRGVSYQTMNDKKNALIDFQACLSINPQYEQAKTAVKQLNGGK
ncbi:MAG: tetratricopeptide repeat protein [Bacteroidia bacterium]